MQPPAEHVHLLVEHPGALPLLQQWFEREWSAYYGPGGRADALQDLRSFLNRSVLPVGVVAVVDGVVCGVAALKAQSIPTHGQLSPWAAAGLVERRQRRMGIGGELLAGLERVAGAMGYPVIYCATSTSESLLRRRGWQLFERVLHDGQDLGVYRKVLVGAG